MMVELKKQKGTTDEPLDTPFTLPNAISAIRMCMVPICFICLINNQNIAATVLFAVAACTDFIDGYLARSTNSVSRVGKLLDPAVDRLLMIFGVLGLYIVGRLQLWIILLVLIRDGIMMVGGAYYYKRWGVRPQVIYAGKVCTTFLFIGFAGLILYMPLLPGLGLVDVSWLPIFNSEPYCLWHWFIYAGLVLGVFTTTYYIKTELSHVKQKKRQAAVGRPD